MIRLSASERLHLTGRASSNRKPTGSSMEDVMGTPVVGAVKKKVSAPRKPALVIIDMQNEYVEDDGWFIQSRGTPYTAQQKAKLYQGCRTLIEAAHGAGVPVIYTRTVLRADGLDSAFSRRMGRPGRGSACLVAGTWGARIVDALRPQPHDIILQKTGLSAFQFTPLHRILRNLCVDSLVLAGGPLYESVNATGRDGSAHGYASFAVPDALYPVDYPNPQFLRMRTRILSTTEALQVLQRPRGLESSHASRPAPDWRALLPDSCLLLIDLQNGFVRRDGFATGPHALWPEYAFRDEEYRRLLANNARLIEWAHGLGLPVINARAVVRPDRIDHALNGETQRHPASTASVGGCFAGDWNSELAEEIALTGGDIELIKQGHSAFAFTILDRMLSNLGVKQCIVTGGNIAGCVEETLRDGNGLGYSMVVVRDATYRPGDPRIELMAGECDIVRTEELVAVSPIDSKRTANGPTLRQRS